MAKCRRCGAVFDYDKKDGVCPRCCFYNRPPGAPHRDEEWISSYNVEENTYELPKSIVETEEEDTGRLFHRKNHKKKTDYRRKISTNKDCHTEGSHEHREGKDQKAWTRSADAGKKKSSGKLVKRLVLLIVVLAIIMTVGKPLLMETGERIHRLITGSFGPGSSEDLPLEVTKRTAEELNGGIRVSDLSLTSDGNGAVVLFEEGGLPGLPKGEMCIGIHLSDNESSIGYSGIYWQRPYVYDGKYYRKLVDKTFMDAQKLNILLNTEFMSEFISDQEDFEGMAVYFVDKDADFVTLCVPDQTVTLNNVHCSGVVQIELPVTRKARGE